MSPTKKHLNTIAILGVPIFCDSLDAAVEEVLRTCSSDAPKLNRCVSATGAHGIVVANKNADFMQILRNFYMNLCDGRPSMWIARLKGKTKITQCPGADFFEAVAIQSSGTDIKHYFCGGKPGVTAALKNSCAQKFNNHNVVGIHTPPFRDMTPAELTSLAADINEKKPDIVWIGISTPKQEIFAARLSPHIQVHFIATIGAAFDFHSNNLKRAPRLISRLGIEWLYRLAKDPLRLYRRTLEVIPAFILLNAHEYFINLFNKKRNSHE